MQAPSGNKSVAHSPTARLRELRIVLPVAPTPLGSYVLKPFEVPAFSLILRQRSVSGSPTGSPTAIDGMLAFGARHSVAPVVEYFPMSKVNDALERLRSGRARYRIVLINDIGKSQTTAESRREEERQAALTAV